jgi:glutamine amidotransferase PdxT
VLGDDVHAVFIRAPWIAEVDGNPVAVRQGNVLASRCTLS